jgi:hypothetical protein
MSAMGHPPALQHSGLLLRRDMRFEHEGALVTHPRVHAALLRGVRFADAEGVWIVQLGRFRAQIDVEDVPFWIVGYDADSGLAQLTDGSREPLAPDTLRSDPDGCLRCTVKSRFDARFTRRAQAELLDVVRATPAGVEIRVGGEWRPAPGL